MGGALSIVLWSLQRLRLDEHERPALQEGRRPRDGGGPGANGGGPPGPPPLWEQHAFLDAAKRYDFARVRSLALANPALVNCTPGGRWSALHQAALWGDEQTVCFLLEHGASTTARTQEGWTPVEVAQPCVFELILQATPGLGFPLENDKKAGCSGDDTILKGLQTSIFEGQNTAAGAELQCMICLDDLQEGDKVRTLPCSHFFHAGCVDEWLTEKSGSCPTCRFEVG